MASFPPVLQIMAHLRAVFGPESIAAPEVLRWWIHGDGGSGAGVALWLRSTPPPSGQPSEVWVTRPFEDEPERCPVTSLEHLTAFIERVKAATRSPAPRPVHKNVCPPSP